MGRPVNKRNFGTLGDNTTPHIPVESANIGGEEKFAEGGADIYILKQKSARRFLVKANDDSPSAVCRLVDKFGDGSSAVTLNAGEMVIIGYREIEDQQAVTIRSLTNRVATDFDGRRYKWSLSDDSTTSILVLSSMT
jgi:hypothetical protein